MRLEIKGLAELRARLNALRPAEIMAAALAAEAERLAQSVRDGLATPHGAGNHDRPWSQTGALHDSIDATASGLEASIGSNDPAAAPQEMGTAHIPPRPFLAPAAATAGPQIAQAVAEALSAALRGESSSAAALRINASVASQPIPAPLPMITPSPDSPVVRQAAKRLEQLFDQYGQGLADLGQALRDEGDAALGHILHSKSKPPQKPAEKAEPDRQKPEFRPNVVHGSRLRPGKSREPSDSKEVYESAERDVDSPESNKLYGRNRDGKWYQYHDDNTGGAHYAGTIDEQKVPNSIRKGRK